MWLLLFLPTAMICILLLKAIFKIDFGKSKSLKTASVLMVVGSGGHTREILSLASSLGKHFSPRYYVLAETDRMSKEKVEHSENCRGGNDMPDDFQIYSIPRSREVKQSYFTSVLTTVRAMMYSFPLVFNLQPDVLLCNGPGTCIPICVAGLLLKFFCIKNTHIVYVESFCRVKTMSLSGKLLYRFVDAFFVQWPDLLINYPKASYVGRLV